MRDNGKPHGRSLDEFPLILKKLLSSDIDFPIYFELFYNSLCCFSFSSRCFWAQMRRIDRHSQATFFIITELCDNRQNTMFPFICFCWIINHRSFEHPFTLTKVLRNTLFIVVRNWPKGAEPNSPHLIGPGNWELLRITNIVERRKFVSPRLIIGIMTAILCSLPYTCWNFFA